MVDDNDKEDFDDEGTGDDYYDFPDLELDEQSDGMAFLEHLEEFRWTLVRSVIAFIVGVAIVVAFMGSMADFLQYPLAKAYGSAETAQENLVTKSPLGVFTVFIQVAFLGGLTLSLPFLLYFVGAFVAPGLTEKERKVLAPACFAAFVLFLTGVAFAFFFILPVTLAFSVRLNDYFNFTLLWTASDYFSMVVWFSLAIGLFFQFPLVVILLVYLRVVTAAALAQSRRIVFVGILVFAAFLTPGGDPISLAIMSVPMYLMYEVSILIGRRLEDKRAAQEELDFEEDDDQ